MKASSSSGNGFYEKICGMLLSFGVVSAMHRGRSFEDIYSAIDRRDISAIARLTAGGGANLNDGNLSQEFTPGRSDLHLAPEKIKCFARPTCMCLICPFCCGAGVHRRTPLYYALEKKVL